MAEREDAPHERRARTPRKSGSNGGKPRNRFLRPGFLSLVLVLLVLNYALVGLVAPEEPQPTIPYSPVFLDEVRAGNVDRISVEGDAVTGELSREIHYPKPSSPGAKAFDTQFPSFVDNERLEALLRDEGVVIDAQPIDPGRGLLLSVLLGFGPVILIIALFVMIARRSGSPLGGFGKSKARRVEQHEQQVTFDDVAGIDESKAELLEVVDYLRSPGRYQKLGGRIPRGVLLAGQPGTGKTLLARAVAGEAKAPFFSVSASEFVEAIVGVGASRVRDLFRQAKEAAPAIIFIDELDAVGRARSGGAGFGSGGSDEREQTLNQILTEMDGFESDATVIVLAATNRPEVLDSALLRPGRFDRRVTVPPPDLEGRRKILEVHTRSVPLAEDADLDRIAATTPGMVGADLANLCNEAALQAARRSHERVTLADFTDALEKIVLGAPRKIMLTDDDRRRTAYHEAGHAIVGMLTPGADPVRKVSIIPRGLALGVTLSAPDTDRVSYDRKGLDARIDMLLGGRVAEELVFDGVTTGAESDIEQVTKIVRAMVGRWGMTEEIGFVAVLPRDGDSPFEIGASETTRHLLDQTVKRIIDEAYERVTRLLTDERERLDSLAHGLLERETVDMDEAYTLAGLDAPPPRDRDDTPAPPPPIEVI